MIGFGSREAIRTFQTAQGLSATGLIDPALLKALKLEHGERQSIVARHIFSWGWRQSVS